MAEENTLYSSLIKSKNEPASSLSQTFKRKPRPLAVLLKVKRGIIENTVVDDILNYTCKTNIKNFVKGPNGHYEVTFSANSILEGFIIKYKVNQNYEFIRRCEKPNITVTLHWVNSAITDKEIISKINQFAKVTSEVRSKTHERIGCTTGRKTILVCRNSLNSKTFPQFLTFNSTAILLTYEGQPQCCYHCHETGHLRKNCQKSTATQDTRSKEKNNVNQQENVITPPVSISNPIVDKTNTEHYHPTAFTSSGTISDMLFMDKNGYPPLPKTAKHKLLVPLSPLKKAAIPNPVLQINDETGIEINNSTKIPENKKISNCDTGNDHVHVIEITVEDKDNFFPINDDEDPTGHDTVSSSATNQTLSTVDVNPVPKASEKLPVNKYLMIPGNKSTSIEVLRLTDPCSYNSEIDIDSLDECKLSHSDNIGTDNVFQDTTDKPLFLTPQKRHKQSSSGGENSLKTPKKKKKLRYRYKKLN